jgi:hypothetical protein
MRGFVSEHPRTGLRGERTVVAGVEKIRDFLVGMTVLRGMCLVKVPPVVSILRVRRQTLMRSLLVPASPERRPA